MKTIVKTTAIAICMFIATAVQAQKIDWANAPINPIPFEYTANHHHFVGNVALVQGESGQILQFDKDGLLIRSIHLGDIKEYLYDSNKKLEEVRIYKKDKNGEDTVFLSVVKFHYKGNKIIKMETASKHWLIKNYNKSFHYNDKGLLSAITKHNGDTLERFEYDEKSRLSRSMIFDLNGDYGQDYDTRYSYEQENDLLKITDEETFETSYYNKQGYRGNEPYDLQIRNTDNRGNVLNTLEEEFGYYYHDGHKTGLTAFLQSADIANFQIISVKERYTKLTIVEDK